MKSMVYMLQNVAVDGLLYITKIISYEMRTLVQGKWIENYLHMKIPNMTELSKCAGTEITVTNQMVIVKILCKMFFKILEY